MDLTSKRRSLVVLAIGMMLGAIAAIGWSFSGVEPTGGVPASTGQADVAVATEQSEQTPRDASVARRSLRGPLYDPPPPPPRVAPTQRPVAPAPAASLDLTLVGTIIDADTSLAIVADASGKFDVKAVGESLELSPEGVVVEKIDSEQVTLQYQGRQSRVELDRTRKGKANRAGRGGNVRRRDNR